MKKIKAKIGTYTKDGEEKGIWVDVGVIRENSNGEYALLDTTISLSGILQAQHKMNPEKSGRSVLCSIWDDSDGFSSQSVAQSPSDDSDDIPW